MSGRIHKIFRQGGILQKSLGNKYEDRSEQEEMASAVHKAITYKEHLVVEAGCGVGKTLAYAIPIAIARGLRCVVSTGTRALQEQLYYKDVPLIQEHIRKGFRVVYIKGRANYLCLNRLNQTKQHSLFDSDEKKTQCIQIDNWAKQTKTGDVSEIHGVTEYDDLWKEVNCTLETCLGYKCDYYNQCFLMKLKKEAKEAHMVIINHHLFFADYMLKTNGGRSILPDYHVIVFDEAHMLEEIATTFLGKVFSTRSIYYLLKDLRQLKHDHLFNHSFLKKALDSVETRFKNSTKVLFDSIAQKKGKFCLQYYDNLNDITQKIIDVQSCLQTFLELSEQLVEVTKEAGVFQQKCLKMQANLDFIRKREDLNYVYWTDISEKARSLEATPINISEIFSEGILQTCKRIIFTSATLTANNSFDYFKSRLGIQECSEAIIDSPFNFAKQGLLYIPRDLPVPKEKTYKEYIETFQERVYDVLLKTEGRAFLLFTSYKNLQKVYKYLSEKDFPYRLLKQKDMGRTQLIDAFSKDTHSVLLATNTFWQGIDVQGPSLSTVIIDKLPFSVPTDPVLKARIHQIELSGGNAFQDYQIPTATILLRQGIGRLIRSIHDTGLVMIGDSRLVKMSYGAKFLRSFPNFKRIYELDEVCIPELNNENII